MGDDRANRPSAIGGRGRAALSLMPDIDGIDSGSLLGSILSTLLKKCPSDVWIVALFFLIIDDMVPLDCTLNNCCKLHVPFYVWLLSLKNQQCLLK